MQRRAAELKKQTQVRYKQVTGSAQRRTPKTALLGIWTCIVEAILMSENRKR
jgi:hypothetical protein